MKCVPPKRSISAGREALAGFRHVDAGIGDETADPGLDSVWDSQERQAAGDCVEGAGFGLGDAKAKGGEDFGLRLGEVKDGALSPASQPFLIRLRKSARQ